MEVRALATGSFAGTTTTREDFYSTVSKMVRMKFDSAAIVCSDTHLFFARVEATHTLLHSMKEGIGSIEIPGAAFVGKYTNHRREFELISKRAETI